MTEELKFREPDWEALRASIHGPQGCTGTCGSRNAIGSGRKGVIGMRLEPCTHRCARPEGHDGTHQCRDHYAKNPAFKRWTRKFKRGDDPCYDGISYIENAMD